MPVVEVLGQGLVIQPDYVYVIPPARYLTISQGVLRLRPRRRHGTNLPIDALFESLALDQGNRAVGVVLSGNGTDGTLGLKQIKAEGGITFVQDEESSKFYGMPGNALHAGFGDLVLPPAGIAKELERISRYSPSAAKGWAKTHPRSPGPKPSW